MSLGSKCSLVKEKLKPALQLPLHLPWLLTAFTLVIFGSQFICMMVIIGCIWGSVGASGKVFFGYSERCNLLVKNHYILFLRMLEGLSVTLLHAMVVGMEPTNILQGPLWIPSLQGNHSNIWRYKGTLGVPQRVNMVVIWMQHGIWTKK